MIVIAPYFEILDELDQQNLAVRIEACGRVCYKSEDKITEESAGPFVKNIIKRGHNSVLEMAVLTLRVVVANEAAAAGFFRVLPKFLIVDRPAVGVYLITGSVRAFREIALSHPDVTMVKAMAAFLRQRHPLLFAGIGAAAAVAPSAAAAPEVAVEKVPLAEVDKLPPDLLARHRHLAVKFYVNRAVTHEIVRHRPCSYLQESQRYCRYGEDKFGGQVTFIKPLFFAEDSVEYRLWAEAMRETERIYLQLLKSVSPQAARTVLPNSCKTELIAFANLLEWRHIFKLRTSAAAEPSMREIMTPLLANFQERFPAVFGERSGEADSA